MRVESTHVRKLRLSLLVILWGTSLFFPLEAKAELSLFLYGGQSWAADSDVNIRQTGGTDLTLRSVSWRTESFQTPIYCGARLMFWLPRLREAGFGLDYTHAKLFADNAQIVEVSGSRFGAKLTGKESVGKTVEDLGFSHGLNFFLLVMQRRWTTGRGFQPFLGAGMGLVIPHIEGRIGETNGNSYRYGGLAYQAQAGFMQHLRKPVSFFTEYKIQRTSLDLPFDSNTQVTTKLWVHQVAAGLLFSF